MTGVIAWCDPPEPGPSRAESPVDQTVAELRERPGDWAQVVEFAMRNDLRPWRRRGCEAVSRTVRRDGIRGFDIYARWPA